ncbi:hypothetical protein QBC35DRAFT_380737, partial [Podospora australis]
YRTATQTRRGARSGYQEADDLEAFAHTGLPVRQWRRGWVSVNTGAPRDADEEDDIWAPDTPFGMPKDTHLLPKYTQDLLRAARSSYTPLKRTAPDDDEDDGYDSVKRERNEDEPAKEGFRVWGWKQLPRNAEKPLPSLLAARHKNTITLASRAGLAHISGPTITRARVRRLDAAGNAYHQTITLTAGQEVDGEIISTEIVPAPDAKEAEKPVKRKPPPPKRKPKGPGRGRKKGTGKLPLPVPATRSQQRLVEGDEADGTQGSPADPTVTVGGGEQGSELQDVDMMDSYFTLSDEEEYGEDDDEEGGDEESNPPDADGNTTANFEAQFSGLDQDQDMVDSDASEAIQPSSVEEPDEEPRRAGSQEEEVTISNPRFSPSGGPNLLSTSHFTSFQVEGSPLKNVMNLSPTEGSPMDSPAGGASISGASYFEIQPASEAMDLDSGGEAPGVPAAVDVSAGSFPSEPTAVAPESPRREQPTIVPPFQGFKDPLDEYAAAIRRQKLKNDEARKRDELQTDSQRHAPAIRVLSSPIRDHQPEQTLSAPAAREEEDGDGLNLLGSLEAELDRQESLSNASGSKPETPLQPVMSSTSSLFDPPPKQIGFYMFAGRYEPYPTVMTRMPPRISGMPPTTKMMMAMMQQGTERQDRPVEDNKGSGNRSNADGSNKDENLDQSTSVPTEEPS